MDELQAGIEPSLAVFPQPPVLLQPGKSALHHPMLCTCVRLGLQRPFAISHLGGGHRHRVRQPLRVHRDVALYARNLLARLNSPSSLPYPRSSRF